MPYLIDGNNLLGSWGGPQGRHDRRAEVVQRVAAFCRARGARATLVFDGPALRPELAEQTLGAVSLRVPGAGRDADSLIRELVEKAARPAEIVVVTSDKALYSYCRTRGAAVLRAHEWNALERSGGHRRASASRPRSEKPDREDDVQGWIERFSRDRKT